jgi:glucosamine--fructose-6-phosphate aminotransferase (isomerizing)
MVDLPDPQTPNPPFGRSRHPYFMHEMIRRQSVAAHATLRSVSEQLTAQPIARPKRSLLLVGIGTSFHAALAAGWAAAPALRPDVEVRACTSFDVAEDPGTIGPGTTAVVFSASGDTALSIAAQRALRERGATSVLISTVEKSPSAELADRLIKTDYSEEASWTHTVSFASALIAFGTLLDTWRGAPLPDEAAQDALSDAVTSALATEPAVLDCVEEFGDRDRFVLLGSGLAEAAAREGALKLREAAGRFCAAVGVEEFLHGVIPSVNDRTVVLGIAGTPLQRTRALAGLAAATKVEAKTLLIDASGGPAEDGILSVPSVDRPLPPVLEVIPLQLLAYWIATGEGHNPDVMGLDDPRTMAARSSFGI